MKNAFLGRVAGVPWNGARVASVGQEKGSSGDRPQPAGARVSGSSTPDAAGSVPRTASSAGQSVLAAAA